MAHELTRHLGNLVQALSQDKRPIAFFVGAGCPASISISPGVPLIPVIAGLTTLVSKAVGSGPHAAAYDTVIKQLQADSIPSPTIEHVLTRVRGLAQIAGSGNARGLTATQLEQVDTAVCEQIATITQCDLPAGQSGYADLASWILSTNRSFPIEIFTTNYDLLIEQALERAKVPYFDGFVGSDIAFFDLHAMEEEAFPSRWVRLWKLHGSLNWFSVSGDVVRTSKALKGQRRVIHPSHLKYDESRKMPYLAMTDRLRAFLRQPAATLVICGYSFADDHINSSLIDGLRGNPSSMAFGLQFGTMATNGAAQRVAEKRPNVCVMTQDAGVVSGRVEPWLEVQSPVAPAGSPQLSWQLVPGSTPPRYRPSLTIGNFRELGVLCRDMVGSTPLWA